MLLVLALLTKLFMFVALSLLHWVALGQVIHSNLWCRHFKKKNSANVKINSFLNVTMIVEQGPKYRNFFLN